MEAVSFSALAPRYGTRPFYGCGTIGISALNGGAINWGNIWNTFKSVGNTVKNAGTRLWNSKTSQAIRRELSNSGAREKLAQGVAMGVHGALDLANQALANKLEQKLGRPLMSQELEAEEIDEAIEPPVIETPVIEKSEVVVPVPAPRKRPREEELLVKEKPPMEETLVMTLDEPPSYEEAIKDMAAPPLPPPRPQPRGPRPPPTPVAPPVSQNYTPPVVSVPPPSSSWLNALNAMTGVGLHGVKRRRCY